MARISFAEAVRKNYTDANERLQGAQAELANAQRVAQAILSLHETELSSAEHPLVLAPEEDAASWPSPFSPVLRFAREEIWIARTVVTQRLHEMDYAEARAQKVYASDREDVQGLALQDAAAHGIAVTLEQRTPAEIEAGYRMYINDLATQALGE